MECGAPAVAGLSRCEAHREQARAFSERHYGERRRAGICRRCDAEVADNGHFCAQHWEDALRAQRERRRSSRIEILTTAAARRAALQEQARALAPVIERRDADLQARWARSADTIALRESVERLEAELLRSLK